MSEPALPEWDTTEVNATEPDATHKAEGFIRNAGVPEKPKFQHFNYWMNLVYKWFKYVKDEVLRKGVPEYSTSKNYVPDDMVTHAGNLFICTTLNGPASAVKGTADTGYWRNLERYTNAAFPGLIELATTGEADTGVDGIRAMTPALVKRLIDARVSGWTALSGNLNTNWYVVGGGWPDPVFRRVDGGKTIQLRGTVGKNTGSDTAIYLPGVSLARAQAFLVPNVFGGGDLAKLYINTSGQVIIQQHSSISYGTTNGIWIDCDIAVD